MGTSGNAQEQGLLATSILAFFFDLISRFEPCSNSIHSAPLLSVPSDLHDSVPSHATPLLSRLSGNVMTCSVMQKIFMIWMLSFGKTGISSISIGAVERDIQGFCAAYLGSRKFKLFICCRLKLHKWDKLKYIIVI